MTKQSVILTFMSLAVIIGGVTFLFIHQRAVSNKDEANQPTAPQPPTESVFSPSPAKATIYYPMASYDSRTTKRTYGQYFSATSTNDLTCGGHFTGYHNGDDLEIVGDELNSEVPVFAIADGTVRQLSRVNGYGGLLIIEYGLASQVVTANYGHIDLTQPQVSVGQVVTAGQVVGYLGTDCSTETDGERKHLHFSLHKGSSIDVKGYLQEEAELASWLNPAEFLKSLSPAEPTA